MSTLLPFIEVCEQENARAEHASPDALTLRLAYRPPFDFAATLAFLQRRALPGIGDWTA